MTLQCYCIEFILAVSLAAAAGRIKHRKLIISLLLVGDDLGF